MTFAVFGDLHGNIKLAYKLCKRWQEEHDRKIDLILQVGDLGVWPDVDKLDRATKRFAFDDWDELGFLEFMEPSDELSDLFISVDANMVFIKGNHADFDFLNSKSGDKRKPVSVDHYGRLIYLPNGATYTFTQDDGQQVKIAGLGGLDRIGCKQSEKKPQGAFFTKTDINKTNMLSGIDILLTHIGHYGKVRDICRKLRPKYHFSGHRHKEQNISMQGETLEAELNSLTFSKGMNVVGMNSFGILNIAEKKKFSFVREPWVSEYTKYAWHYL